MTRIGRFVAGVGATVLALVVTVGYFFLVGELQPGPPLVWGLFLYLVGLAVFGVVAAALYTWAVNGPFVRRRQRSH